MVNLIMRFAKARSGGTAVEYSMVAALVAAAALGGIDAYGEALENLFLEIAGTLEAVAAEIRLEI